MSLCECVCVLIPNFVSLLGLFQGSSSKEYHGVTYRYISPQVATTTQRAQLVTWLDCGSGSLAPEARLQRGPAAARSQS